MAPRSVTMAPIKKSNTASFSDTASTTSKTTTGVALKPVRPYQDRVFECTYEWCHHKFESEKDMKRHKKTAEDHYYCKKCDVDCDDWEQLTAHKVEVMAPFVEGTKKPTEEDPPIHICCEFCGEDFGSFGGRKRHRAQYHPADQDIDCPGCTAKFVRAANMVAHLEKNHCPGIRAHEFKANIQHRYIVPQLMVNGGEYVTKSLAANTLEASKEPGLIKDNEEDEEDESGGVILDMADEGQMGGHKPLEPEVDLMSPDVPSTSAHDQRWPTLPGKDTAGLTRAMNGMALSATPTIASDDETASQSTTAAGSTVDSQAVWSSGNTSKALFPMAEYKKPDWGAVQKSREVELAADDDTNLFKARIWDPSSEKYDVERFFNPVIQKYCCPLASCAQDQAEYITASDFEVHFRTAHMKSIYNCPSCFKRWDTVTALVAHAESTKKCGIRASDGFKKFMSDITGGFLQAKEMHVPKIYRPSTDVVKPGQPMNGVMSNKYIGSKPTW